MKFKTLAFAAAAATVSLSSGAAMAAGDAAAGENISKRCIACHSFEDGGPNKIGPNLYGVVGNECGKQPGFKYSKGYMKACEAGQWSWTEENIMAYLPNPSEYLSEHAGEKVRSRMSFMLKGEKDRQDVIAYMKTMQD